MTNKQVYYHSNCVDGFTAAWVAWRRFGQEAVYTPIDYGAEIPQATCDDEIYFLNISPPKDALLSMFTYSHSVVVLDHHATAKERLGDLNCCRFDTNKSGARLALEMWPFDCWYDSPLVAYTEDYDLYRFDKERSKEVNAYIRSTPFSFWQWDELERELRDEFYSVVVRGEAILRYREKAIEDAVLRANSVGSHDENRNPCKVYVVNASGEILSDLLHRLAKDVHYSVGWYELKPGVYRYELRSAPGGAEVNRIAERFGGGGHKHAAAFTHTSSIF